MKPFKTLDQQIEILEARGLIITDYDKTKHYLLQHSYYNVINVYSKFFQEKENNYVSGSTFDEIRAVHIFDTEIKSVLFRYLLECEKHFKSILAYRFSEYHKDIPYAYLKTTSYVDDNLLNLTSTISQMSRIISTNLRDRKPNLIKHYNNNHRDVPLWILIKHLTFGQSVHLFLHLDDKLKNIIAIDLARYLEENAGTRIVIEPKEIENMLFNLISVRNCVAHNNKLFSFKCRNHLKYHNAIHNKHNLKKQQSRQDVFNVILSMQCFLEKSQYSLLYNTILKRGRRLNGKLSSVSINTILGSLGFPDNWITTTKKIEQV